MWVDDRSTEKPPLRPALLAGVAAWRSRCPFCQQSMIAAPVDASFCKRCGHSLQRHAQRFPTGDFEAWLPRAVGPYQVIPSLSVRHADILSTAQDTRSGAGVILQLMQIDGDPFGPWHAHFEKAIGGFRTLGHGMEGQLLWVAVDPASAVLLPDWTTLFARSPGLTSAPPPLKSAGPSGTKVPIKSGGGWFGWVLVLALAGGACYWFVNRAHLPGTSVKPYTFPIPDNNTGGTKSIAPIVSDTDRRRIDGLLNLGIQANARRQWDTAIQHLDEYNRARPIQAPARAALADAYLGKGDLFNAEQNITEALRLNPNDARTLGNRGVLRQRQRHFELAIRDYTDALAMDPSQTWIKTNLAALTAYTESDARAEWDRGNADLYDGNWAAAVRAFQHYTQLRPSDSNGFAQWSIALANRNDSDAKPPDMIKADQMVAQALTLQPRNATALGARGLIRERQGRYREAREDYSAALVANPNLTWVRDNLLRLPAGKY